MTFHKTLIGLLASASGAWITGTLGSGNVLTANLAPALGTATTWQWTRNGTNIGGATPSTYTQQEADVGTTVGVLINGTYRASVSVPAATSGNRYIARRVSGNAVYA